MHLFYSRIDVVVCVCFMYDVISLSSVRNSLLKKSSRREKKKWRATSGMCKTAARDLGLVEVWDLTRLKFIQLLGLGLSEM